MTGVIQPFLFAANRWSQFLMEAGPGQGISGEESALPAVEDEDLLLMQRLQGGDPDAFAKLFEKWKRPLISFFFRSTGNYHTAEDLALEVAAKVYTARHRYRPRARFSTWMFQIARNRLIDWYRRNGNRSESSASFADIEWAYPGMGNSSDDHERKVWEEWLQSALMDLPESEKTALLLVVQQGMTPSEAAETMKIKPNHLRVLLSNGRKRLRLLREREI